MKLSKYSFGIGDRFGCQGSAQLAAFVEAKKLGIEITPVWNKSNREHTTIHTKPSDVRKEADKAVGDANWDGAYFVDADHINLSCVDKFINSSDFFTLDVADYIGEESNSADVTDFVKKYKKFAGELSIPGIDEKFLASEPDLQIIAEKYLNAIKEAGKIYRHVEGVRSRPWRDKCQACPAAGGVSDVSNSPPCEGGVPACPAHAGEGRGGFATTPPLHYSTTPPMARTGKCGLLIEVSMDETEKPQTPLELLFILAMIADEKIPAQTIAPKFSGRFNKGVEYVGDIAQFAKEFEDDLAVIQFAIKNFGLNENLKLSVHSGSDKFAIYPAINKAIKKYDTGVHVKTAGTTWLEELIGLAESGGEALNIAKEIYRKAFDRYDELAAPYATVIDIDNEELPKPNVVDSWDSTKYVDSLRHDRTNKNYNQSFRQLLHVGYKIAAELGDKYINALKENKEIVAKNVTENILERHIKIIFAK